jgi:hypothetical protein
MIVVCVITNGLSSILLMNRTLIHIFLLLSRFEHDVVFCFFIFPVSRTATLYLNMKLYQHFVVDLNWTWRTRKSPWKSISVDDRTSNA